MADDDIARLDRIGVLAAIRQSRAEVGAAALEQRARLQARLKEIDAGWDVASRVARSGNKEPPPYTTSTTTNQTGRSLYVPTRIPRWLAEKADAWGKANGKNRSQVIVAALTLLLGDQ